MLWVTPYKTLHEALAVAIDNIEKSKDLDAVFIYGSKMNAEGLVIKEGRSYKWYAYRPKSNKTSPPVTLNKNGTPRRS